MSLLPLMKLRLATPAVVVDVGRLRDLSYVRDAGDHIAIGALTRHRDVETNDLLAQECGVLAASPPKWATTRCGTAARSAGRSRTATRRPTFRPRSSHSTRPSSSRVRVGRAESRRRVLPRLLGDRARARRAAARDPRPQSGADGFAFEKFNRRAQDFATVGVVAACNGSPRGGSSTWAPRPCARLPSSRRWPGRVGGRRRRARGRRHRARGRSQRVGRVPRAPGPGARAPRARGIYRVSRLGARCTSCSRGRVGGGPGAPLRGRHAEAAGALPRPAPRAARSRRRARERAGTGGGGRIRQPRGGAVEPRSRPRWSATTPDRGISSSLQAALRSLDAPDRRGDRGPRRPAPGGRGCVPPRRAARRRRSACGRDLRRPARGTRC